MPRQKNAMTLGLEKILNDPRSSPLNNPGVFKQIASSSGQSITSALKYIGKKSKMPKETDDDKSKERIARLESASEEK